MTLEGKAEHREVGMMLVLALGLLVAAYFVQAWTPLRLNNDAVLCMMMADQAVDRGAWIAEYDRTMVSGSVALPGYPSVVAGLIRMGLGQSWALVMLNQVCLLAGIAAAMRICIDWGLSRRESVLVAIGTLLSWIMIKHATLPLTDMMFFALAMNSVMFAQRAAQRGEENRWIAAWCVAAILAVLATYTRIIGVTLIPALAVALVFPDGAAWRAIERLIARKMVVVGVVVCVIAGAATTIWISSETDYGVELAKRHREMGGIFAAIVTQGDMRLYELGLAVLNLPASAVPLRMVAGVYVAGLCVGVALAMGAWRVRKLADPALMFFAAYFAILVAWPFLDPRFLLPVVPLGIACVMLAWKRFNFGKLGRLVGRALACGYAGLGVIALVMTTKVTFSGEQFPESYNHGGQFEASYQAAWGQPHDASKVMPQVLQVLKRHEFAGKRGTLSEE